MIYHHAGHPAGISLVICLTVTAWVTLCTSAVPPKPGCAGALLVLPSSAKPWRRGQNDAWREKRRGTPGNTGRWRRSMALVAENALKWWKKVEKSENSMVYEHENPIEMHFEGFNPQTMVKIWVIWSYSGMVINPLLYIYITTNMYIYNYDIYIYITYIYIYIHVTYIYIYLYNYIYM